MKLSFEKKIVAGYIVNMLVIFALGIIHIKVLPFSSENTWHWVILVLIVMSLGMLTTVFFILKAQLKAKKKYSQALQNNERLLQSIIENTTSAISVKKINGEYLLVNKEFQSLIAPQEATLVGKTNEDFLIKEKAEIYRNADLEVLKAGKEIQIEETFDYQEETHTYLSVKFPLFDASNRIYAIGNISTDISPRKSLLDSLKAADTFFNMSIDSLVIASPERFLKINPSLTNLLGYSTSELMEKPFTAFIFPDDIAPTESEIKKLSKGSSLLNFKNRWVCKDGSIKWLSWNATADQVSGTIYAIVRDITEELRLVEEKEEMLSELYEEQQKLNIILENISDGVLVANDKKEVILANEVANRLFEIEEDSQISINFTENFQVLFPDDHRTFPVQDLPAERAFKGEVTYDIDVILKHLLTNEIHRVLLSGRPIVDTENRVVAVVITIKDISEYKKLEDDMEKREQENRPLIGFKPRKRS